MFKLVFIVIGVILLIGGLLFLALITALKVFFGSSHSLGPEDLEYITTEGIPRDQAFPTIDDPS